MDRYESLLITEMKNVFADDPKRIDHALSVLEFTKKIMKIEGGDQEIIVPSAILHDIGIKECERKYHSTMGNLQEKEGPPIAQLILKKIDYPSELTKEILNIIGNHHSPGRVTSLNFQILYEADRLVNLADDFEHLDMAKKEKMIIRNFKTKTGIKLAKNLFLKRR